MIEAGKESCEDRVETVEEMGGQRGKRCDLPGATCVFRDPKGQPPSVT